MSDNYSIKPKPHTPIMERFLLRTKLGKRLIDVGINAGIRRGTATTIRRAMSTRGYDVGETNRLTADRPIQWLSPDAMIRFYLMNIRDRMRTMEMNDSKAKRVLSMYKMGTVGPYGMKLQVKGRDADGSLDKVGNKLVENHFAEWAKKGNCTVDGRQSFREVQDELVGDEFRDGEAALRFVQNKKFKYGIAIDLVPTEWIDIWYNVVTDNGGLIKMGVEMDDYNRPIAYWIRMPSPATELTGNFLAGERTRIPAEEFLLSYQKLYARHTRAVSRMSAVGMTLLMRNGYQDATMVRARKAAGKSGYIKQGEDSNIDVAWDDEDENGNPVMIEEPGVDKVLPKNTEYQPNEDHFPGTEHEPFMRDMNEDLASGTDTAYATLTTDLSRANMSSDRSGRLDERDSFLKNQQWLAESFLTPVYDHVRPFLFLSGQMQINGRPFPFKPEKYAPHTWMGRGWKLFNPLQDVRAKQLEEGMFHTTGTDDAAEQGENFEENVEARIEEIKTIIEKSTGIRPTTIDPILALAGIMPPQTVGAAEIQQESDLGDPEVDDQGNPVTPPEGTKTINGKKYYSEETYRSLLEERYSPAQLEKIFEGGNHNGH